MSCVSLDFGTNGGILLLAFIVPASTKLYCIVSGKFLEPLDIFLFFGAFCHKRSA